MVSLIRSEAIKLRHNPQQDEWPYLHFARFTSAGNALIWVHNYDIYYRQEVRASHAYRITHDAVPGVVYNGIPDWLYEGEFIMHHNKSAIKGDLNVLKIHEWQLIRVASKKLNYFYNK